MASWDDIDTGLDKIDDVLDDLSDSLDEHRNESFNLESRLAILAIMLFVCVAIFSVLMFWYPVKDEECLCNGCSTTYMNIYQNQSVGNYNVVSCCYNSYKDKNGQCHRDYQDKILTNLTYTEWVGLD